MMVCLNGVHVEAQGLLSITTAVTLAVGLIMLVWGAPSPQRHADLKTDKVRDLCMCCVISLLLSPVCHSLPDSFFKIDQCIHASV